MNSMHHYRMIILLHIFLIFPKLTYAEVISHPDPASIAEDLSPYQVTYQDYDTDNNNIADYRIVGDFDGDGRLEWDDIQAAVDGLCDPNGDGRQDEMDGKLDDLDGDGETDDPYCGTLHILPGTWYSRTELDESLYNKKDDQIWLQNYQGLWFRGSGVNDTILISSYSRQEYCHAHHETGCGGVCSRESNGYLTLSDFTIDGLEPRRWGKMDCDGDGFDAGNPNETDYTSRVAQTVVDVFNTAPHVGKKIKAYNILVRKADYRGFAFGNIENLYVSNLSVLGAGSTGIAFTGVQNSRAQNLHVENADGVITGSGILVSTLRGAPGKPNPLKTHNFTIDGAALRHNHIGIGINALGSGGIQNVTIKNVDIFESQDATGLSSPYTQFGIYFQDNGCLWDEDGDGRVDERCYLSDITIDQGSVIGCPGYGLSSLLAPNGPYRNFTVRGIQFEGNGHGIGGNESRDVNLSKMPGTVFENNTIHGVDYNKDGEADHGYLMVNINSDDTVIADNTFSGMIKENGKLLFVKTSRNVQVANNNLNCEDSDKCIPLHLWSDTKDITVEGNIFSLNNHAGIKKSIIVYGDDIGIHGNFFKGGQHISANGENLSINSNMEIE